MNPIEVSHLSKIFRIYRKPSDRIKEALCFKRRYYHQTFWALKDVSFSVKKATTVGVVGQNGSGKSTLLKILAGLMLPSEGRVTVVGKRSSLIELGMGFHPEFSGRSNIYLNSALLGIPKDEIDAKFDQIVNFSGIGDFIDQPMKTYSSGMYVRLAFSVAISVDPEILLIDEVLAVGDALFSQKCIRKLREFQEKGVTIFFVSHDLGAIKNLCDEAILLDKGVFVERGSPQDISESYVALIQKRYTEETRQYAFVQRVENEEKGRRHRYGNLDAMISDIKLVNSIGEEISGVISGEICIVRVKAIFFEDVENAVVGILIRDRLGNEVFGTNTGFHDQNTGPIGRDEQLAVNFRFQMNVGPGDYSVTAAIHPDKLGLEGHFDWIDRAVSFRVFPAEPQFIGLSKLTPEICIERLKTTDPSSSDSVLDAVFPDALDYVEMDDHFRRFLVKGWYQPEIWQDGNVRWTRKEPVFIMKVSGRKIKLEASTSKPRLDKEPVVGEIFCNGRGIGSFVLKEHGWQKMCFQIEEKLKGEVVRFKIVLNQTWRPDDFLGNGDKRDLGIAVRRVWCEN